ncbi:F-box and WD repeat domain containing 7, E3 ubiquitin protein ligase [Nesidiocoris tenuis]|uniref:F-box and WD repeat domain containing 7, E3 ubiquitin protein ligase n=1 Tax=Nesidiocoris tenuis TaxID=355587 RepID=A0ABN7B412_9HEMI|nr:F-box and WD repeat domain containing 7, E3 ubiquitin protein ligase [Nesidiocoris tenuis]
MDISNLPVEILEEIFIYLENKDLVKCTYVCYQWREIINSNKIWSIQCAKEKILHKPYLQTSHSLISNPVKSFRDMTYEPGTRLTPPCHWRLHFNRYKYLERNWREGNYSMMRSKANAKHYRDRLILSSNGTGFLVWSVERLSAPVAGILCGHIDLVRTKDDLVFYTQEDRLTCRKRCSSGFDFDEAYSISFGGEANHSNDCRSLIGRRLSLKITDKFLVVLDAMHACSLYIHDYRTGEQLRKVDLHAYTGRTCPQITCLKAMDEKVFVAYNLNLQYYILVYNYTTDQLDVKVSAPLQSSKLVVSKNFFGAKLVDSSQPVTVMDKSCELHVWSIHTGVVVELLLTNRSLPVILTSDDKLVYSDNYKVYVRGLLNSRHDVDLTIESRLSGVECIWDNLLVLNLGTCLQLWDIETGQKLHTYLRENIDDMWVDDEHIVVRLNASPWMPRQSYVISFW